MSGRKLSFIAIASVLATAFFSACGTLHLSPLSDEERIVRVISSDTMAVAFLKDYAADDSKYKSCTIYLPKGVYYLEAEDDTYRYFKAPFPLEFRGFTRGEVTDQRFMPGGLMVPKKSSTMASAAAYIDEDDPHHKMVIWKFDGKFAKEEGTVWKKSF